MPTGKASNVDVLGLMCIIHVSWILDFLGLTSCMGNPMYCKHTSKQDRTLGHTNLDILKRLIYTFKISQSRANRVISQGRIAFREDLIVCCSYTLTQRSSGISWSLQNEVKGVSANISVSCSAALTT